MQPPTKGCLTLNIFKHWIIHAIFLFHKYVSKVAYLEADTYCYHLLKKI